MLEMAGSFNALSSTGDDNATGGLLAVYRLQQKPARTVDFGSVFPC
jgi:hypothetical protein